MSGLVLTLRESPAQRVDMSALTPDPLAGRTLDYVAAMTLPCGNRKLRVDELFEISGKPVEPREKAQIAIRNASSKLDRIGSGMIAGTIAVEGDAGAYAGFGMKGGRLEISAGAGPFAAAAMSGGEISIGGDAGDFLGGALPGDRTGMRGGLVTVAGDAGARAGDHLRRGMLLIAGAAGPYCGARMIAGTIVVLGQAGDFIGFGMHRGTILLWREPARMPATFNDCGSHELHFLSLMFDYARGRGKTFAALDRFGCRVRRLAGDRGVGGLGEILIRDA